MNKEKRSKPGYGRILDAWAPPEHAGEPVGCVATSFTFSPTLFEAECMGRFLQLETSAEEDGPAYFVEREEKIAQLICAAALVDQHHVCGRASVRRSLRWDLLPARLQRGCGILHAKVSLLLWSQHARLVVASANLTEGGYRQNQEVFAALDYSTRSESPLSVLDESLEFLREAVAFAQPVGGSGITAAVRRWLDFLDRVTADSREWGVMKPPRSWTKPRVFAVLTGPDRPSVFESLRERWPGSSYPDRAFVVSPFFDDPPDGSNKPAHQIWGLLKQHGGAFVEYHVTAEEVPAKNVLRLHAPKSLTTAQPAGRSQVETTVQRLRLEDNRPLHAKCVWLESDRLILSMIGSSNFTSAGLGLSRVRNIEANLAFVVGQQRSDAKRALENAWLEVDEIPKGTELLWQPQADEGEDSADDDLLLPGAFADVLFGSDPIAGNYVEFAFSSDPPSGWIMFAEEDVEEFATEAEWLAQGRPASWRISWTRPRPPYGFRVSWRDSRGFACWPVNVVDGAALPPPDDLKDLPLEVLIEILTSAKPLHLALARWLKRNRSGSLCDHGTPLDPHKRVDTSTFLLQRTRRVSEALSALRQRLEKPVFSDQSLTWRLRGPIGALALVNAIEKDLAREQRPEIERCFLLTEVCFELAHMRPKEVSGSLSKTCVRKAVRKLVAEIRTRISTDALAGEPTFAAYTRRVFEEVGE